MWGSGPQFGTPLYYRPHLERFPERSAAAVAAIARGAPGAGVVHGSAGRGRAGEVALVVLALARAAALGHDDQGPMLAAYLAERGTTAAALLAELAADLDAEALLRGGGLTSADVAAIRERLLE